MNDNLIIYHAGCYDGFCAAWLFKKVFPDAQFVSAHYNNTPPNCSGKNVYIVDFSYSREIMHKILGQANFVCVLDHHKTAEAELSGLVDEFVMRPDLVKSNGGQLPYVRFDMDKSGGRLAYEYICEFFRPEWQQKPVPWLVEYTEDRDLWRWSLPKSKEISCYLRSQNLDFDLWDKLELIDINSIISKGEAIYSMEQKLVQQHLRHAQDVVIDGYQVKAVNATCLISEIAGSLAEGQPFGVAYFFNHDQAIFSLRSRDGGIDVSEVAKKYGGGGHRNASGFTINKKLFQEFFGV